MSEIRFNPGDDNLAEWIVDLAEFAKWQDKQLHRPCDRCDGHGTTPEDEQFGWCRACDGFGRHTWTLTITKANQSEQYRVHVLDVLPSSDAEPRKVVIRLWVH